MTTRWKQKASLALAIITILSLFLLIILLWSAFKNDIFKSNNLNQNNNININDNNIINNDNLLNNDFITNSIKSNRTRTNNLNNINNNKNKNIDWNKNDYHHNDDDSNNNRNNNKKLQNDLNEKLNKNEEFVKPAKVHHLPLHTDDLLYESKRNNKTIKDEDYYQGYRITGNYRNKSYKIWDPHPEYTINAFGHHMHLILYQDTSFVPKTLKVTHVYENSTHNRPHLNDDHHLECHYKGHILDDDKSLVSVSLCDGMSGHIRTSFGSFLIEPIENYTKIENDTELLHKIWKETNDFNDAHKSSCPIEEHNHNNDNSNNIEDKILTDIGNYKIQHNLPSINRRRKRDVYDEHQYTLEVLIAVDRLMIDFHGEHNIKSYVLTLMGTVSSIFSDASIGFSINVVASEILLLSDDLSPQSYNLGVSAPHYLKRFCQFIQRRNFQYDTAVLITRHTICRNETELQCNTLGLAELGTVCRKNSCSLVVDNGLSAAFTIAHELGHIFNAPHDDDKKCQKYEKDGKKSLNIMSSIMASDIHPWTWSDCSRNYIDDFLERENVECMEESLQNRITATNKRLPGEIYDLNEQCQLIFGPRSSLCTISYELMAGSNECSQLYCQDEHSRDSCKANGPWADGTPCRDHTNFWCQKGECVLRDSHLMKPINGDWGSWGSWSQCSRTCGGGVQESQRECNSPTPRYGGKYCYGNRRKYRSCNSNDCPMDLIDFREQQCAKHNGVTTMQGLPAHTRWVPKYGVPKRDECKLHCRVDGGTYYAPLAEKVIDGTPCSFESFDKCVNGVCHPAGCDNELNSAAQLDRCGVCNGQNDSCNEVVTNFFKSSLQSAISTNKEITYYHVGVIPKGAANIEIMEKGSWRYNYIVLDGEDGKNLLNGNRVITIYKKTFVYGGLLFEYNGSQNFIERVNTTYARKLKHDLRVSLIILEPDEIGDNELLLTISYTMPKSVESSHHQYSNHYDPYHSQSPNNNNNHHHHRHQQPKQEIYKWEADHWSPCDSICKGQHFRKLVCIQVNAGRKVPSSFCELSLKPNIELTSECNQECEIEPKVISTSECSATCGSNGLRAKVYNCIQKFLNGSQAIIDLSYCAAKFSMSQYEDCREACWSYTEWSACSRSCSTGQKSRSVVCIFDGSKVDESHCSSQKRNNFNEIIQICNIDPCPAWVREEPSACSVTCGNGQRTSAIYCKQNNDIVDKSLCSNLTMPNTIENCTMPPCPIEQHISRRPTVISRYPSYSSTYNPNNNNQNNYHVESAHLDRNNMVSRNDNSPRFESSYNSRGSHHRHNEPPTTQQPDILSNNVNSEEEDTASWVTSDWGECNDQCERIRSVRCEATYPQSCPMNNKPLARKKCCNIKYVARLSACSTECGNGVRNKEFYCARVFKAEGPNGKRRKVPVNQNSCRHLNKPNASPFTKPCKESCNWSYGTWSQCAADCNPEYSSRSIVCRNKQGKEIGPKYCDSARKPISYKRCTNCNRSVRVEHRISNCTCDGYRRNRVICFDSLNKHIPCPPQYKSTKERCHPPIGCQPRSCLELRRYKNIMDDGEYTISIKRKHIKIYCHNMKSKPAEYIKINSLENYSVYYDKRARNTEQCPPESRGTEFRDASINSGSTRFEKIRLNIHNLNINTEDYTFATTRGISQPYGSAGDCYNKNRQCPQGYFSINLSNTGFRIRPNVQWDIDGDFSKMEFAQKLEYPYQIVRGFCGGYCGHCYISQNSSLALDIV